MPFLVCEACKSILRRSISAVYCWMRARFISRWFTCTNEDAEPPRLPASLPGLAAGASAGEEAYTHALTRRQGGPRAGCGCSWPGRRSPASTGFPPGTT